MLLKVKSNSERSVLSAMFSGSHAVSQSPFKSSWLQISKEWLYHSIFFSISLIKWKMVINGPKQKPHAEDWRVAPSNLNHSTHKLGPRGRQRNPHREDSDHRDLEGEYKLNGERQGGVTCWGNNCRIVYPYFYYLLCFFSCWLLLHIQSLNGYFFGI